MADEVEQLAAGWAALRAGRADEAERLADVAVAADPGNADGWFLLGAARQTLGRPADAADCYARVLEHRSDDADAHYHRGVALGVLSRFSEAADCYRRVVERRPDDAGALANLGNTLRALGQPAEAEGFYRRALERRPGGPIILLNLGNTLRELGRHAEAEGCYRQALEANADLPELHTNLGSALLALGRLDEAIACYRRAQELRPGDSVAHDNLILALHYRVGVTPQDLFVAHAEYQERHAVPLRAEWRPHTNDRDPERPLRLGLVSPDFGRHPVGFLLVRAVEALAGRPGSIVCYSDRRISSDELTARFRAAAHVWRDTVGLTDAQLAEQVRADGIDVLIDLAGHTKGNRLLAFARKPAPVQCSWLGYEGATGLDAIDFLVADERLIPPGADVYYHGRVLRLPGGYAAYDAPPHAPAPGPPPALSAARVTFGCFNNPAKLSGPALAAFAQVLRRVPGARLLLKYRGLDDPATGGQLMERFATVGGEPRHIDLRGVSAPAEYMAAYRAVDIALDPFPFGGGVTTCDALWMGIPVVTLPGATFASRHGLGYLWAVDLADELAARDTEDYTARAVNLAQDLNRLAALRARLRGRLAHSPLCDGDRLADELLTALRPAWRAWAAAP